MNTRDEPVTNWRAFYSNAFDSIQKIRVLFRCLAHGQPSLGDEIDADLIEAIGALGEEIVDALHRSLDDLGNASDIWEQRAERKTDRKQEESLRVAEKRLRAINRILKSSDIEIDNFITLLGAQGEISG